MRTLICTLLPCLLFTNLNAQTGSLDNSFNKNGKVITPIGRGKEIARDIAIQKDGKIIVAGTSVTDAGRYEFAIVRYYSDGSIDKSFNEGGKVTTHLGSGDAEAYAVTVQADGKILAAGYCQGTHDDFALVRYNPDGSLDKSFGNGGMVIASFGENSDDAIAGISLQCDQKILVVGYTSIASHYDFALARFNSNGTFDLSFDGDGKQTTDIGGATNDFAGGIAIQHDDKIVLAGYTVNHSEDFALIRYNKDGSVDKTFGANGKQVTDIGTSSGDKAVKVAMQEDGKIVLAGTVNNGTNNFGLARYNADGSIDKGFGNNGSLISNVGTSSSDNQLNALDIQNDNKIVVAGFSSTAGSYNFIVARYTTSGAPDKSFNNNGYVSTDILSDQADYAYAVKLFGRRIYVAGYVYNLGNADFAVTALKNDAAALMLNFSHVEATIRNKVCDLQWNIEQEWQVTEFTVQRSIDGVSFSAIGEIDAFNESISSKYSFTDASPTSGLNYYRILIKDQEGKSTYTKIVTAAFVRQMHIVPNPVYTTMQVKLPDGLNGSNQLQIFDMAGKLVKTVQIELTGSSLTIPVNVRDLSKGVYIVNIAGAESGLVQRFVKLGD
jgi:uncharacterized delta-60 repeat protein